MELFALLCAALLAILTACLVLWALARGGRRSLRAKLLALPAPPEWDPVLLRNVAVYRRLPGPLKGRLAGLVHVFLHEKRFEGCGGLEMTDEIRVTVAAQACILLLGGAGRFFPRMQSIFVYPSTFLPVQRGRHGILTDDPRPRRGESWYRGPVVLAWDAAAHRLSDPRPGDNVVMHEFAHQLDSEDREVDGTPPLPDRSAYAEWARVFHAEFEALRRRAQRGRKDVIDEYGATNPAEFFAVATAAFFERSRAFRGRHPDLYRQLQGYFNLDPAEWPGPAAAGER